ncbi:hypothetical protein E4U43_000077 [Claviceps pusilla]|uniref:Signal recognition particle protein Sec65 n=1 Tax=Claviceps pusilla TaxID=123648 RepID=A0A9P7NCK0_9HYPO|nr:hypothetical protein E4U43_000077 [Claviceps pusilla]
MSHPQVEEVSDSDQDMVSDPDEDNIDDFLDSDIMRRIPVQQQQPQQPQQQQPRRQQKQPPSPPSAPPPAQSFPDRSAFNSYQCLYPLYFDALRSRAQGRRVPAPLASHSPLAREIANACSRLRLQTVLEPDKTHPKDWANPGRVKVCLKPAAAAGAGPAPSHGVRNKHHLYMLVAKHLLENPTTEHSPGLRVRMGGQIQPPEGTAYPRPAVPRGWKMSEWVPYVSPAMTGGGVSENLFKDMMREMQAGGNPMAALMGGAGAAPAEEGGGRAGPGAGAGGRKKKDKKGKGKS